MGTMIRIECQNCHYMKPFQLGIGFAFSPHRLLDVNSEDSFITFPHTIKENLCI